MKHLFLFLAITLATFHVKAQYPAVTIPDSEVRTITSKIVVGQEYQLHILLPGGYKKTNKKYPVVYLMDSQWDFPLVKSIYGQQYFDGFIPEVIIVGVTWGGNNPNPDSLRARDYTPTNESRQPQSGGADNFLSFIKNELFPFMETNYTTDVNNRTLMGCSLGGLFTMYTLFTHPEMFTGYAAASPAIGWDKEVLYQYEKKYVENKSNPPAKLYITIGDVERNVPNFEKMVSHLQSRKYTSLQITSKVLENTGHSGTKSETYTRGLQYIFKKPDVKVDEVILSKYAGTYQTVAGNNIELRVENYQLVLYLNAANRYVLKASSDKTFYSTAEILNIVMNADGNGFQLNRYGDSQSATKK